MKWLAGMAMLVVAVSASAESYDGYRWKRVAEVSNVQVELIEVPFANDMKRIRHQYARGAQRANGSMMSPLGFSVLYRDTDGTMRCLIYVRDLDDAATIEHEKRHCDGWQHN